MILELNVLKNNIYCMLHNWKSFNEAREPFNTKGDYKNVYTSKTNPDIVIKKFNSRHDYMIKNEIKFCNTAPDLFAKIYKVDFKKCVILQQKLDTLSTYEDLKKMGDYFFNLNLIDSKSDYEILNFIKTIVVQNTSMEEVKNFMEDKILFEIVNKWVFIIKKVIKIGVELDIPFDINPNNFGYDKEGNLKMFDI